MSCLSTQLAALVFQFSEKENRLGETRDRDSNTLKLRRKKLATDLVEACDTADINVTTLMYDLQHVHEELLEISHIYTKDLGLLKVNLGIDLNTTIEQDARVNIPRKNATASAWKWKVSEVEGGTWSDEMNHTDLLEYLKNLTGATITSHDMMSKLDNSMPGASARSTKKQQPFSEFKRMVGKRGDENMKQLWFMYTVRV